MDNRFMKVTLKSNWSCYIANLGQLLWIFKPTYGISDTGLLKDIFSLKNKCALYAVKYGSFAC